MPDRRLIAMDEDDLAVLSAHVLDASVRTADIIWRQNDKRLVIGMQRLDWDAALAGHEDPPRMVSALRFDRVLACKSRNIDLAAPETTLDLLGIEFHPQGAGGSALLIFARDAVLRLDVECLECELADLGGSEFEDEDENAVADADDDGLGAEEPRPAGSRTSLHSSKD